MIIYNTYLLYIYTVYIYYIDYIVYIYTYMLLLKIGVISLPARLPRINCVETTCPPDGVCLVVPRAGTW